MRDLSGWPAFGLCPHPKEDEIIEAITISDDGRFLPILRCLRCGKKTEYE